MTVTGSSGSLSHSVSLSATVQPSLSVGGTLLPSNTIAMSMPYLELGVAVLATVLVVVTVSSQASRRKIRGLESKLTLETD